MSKTSSDVVFTCSPRIESIASILSLDGLSAIDLGCKTGYDTLSLNMLGCRPVVGVEKRDLYLYVPEQHRKKLGYEDVEFIRLDVRSIDAEIEDVFDLCLCSGLLYHMMDPVDLLVRIRSICKSLILETHVAPEWYSFFLTRNKYRNGLQLKKSIIRYRNEESTGRYNLLIEWDDFPTSGSLDSISLAKPLMSKGGVARRAHSSFWLDVASIKRALSIAGFEINAFYFGHTPSGLPNIMVNHGYRSSKIFVVAN